MREEERTRFEPFKVLLSIFSPLHFAGHYCYLSYIIYFIHLRILCICNMHAFMVGCPNSSSRFHSTLASTSLHLSKHACTFPCSFLNRILFCFYLSPLLILDSLNSFVGISSKNHSPNCTFVWHTLALRLFKKYFA